MKPKPVQHPGPLEPCDERDTIFARAALKSGTRAYDAYYAAHPDRRDGDDRFRALPHLASPESPRYSAPEAALVDSLFEASDLLADGVEARAGAWSAPGGRIDAAALGRFARRAARILGADDVGVAPLDPTFVYTHRGRRPDRAGEPVRLDHGRAIVLVFAMRRRFLAASPNLIATVETARVYLRAANACFTLAAALHRLGCMARPHVDASYLVGCTPLAAAAGLGEVGRNGVLVHRRFGPGVRLGVVTINVEIDIDSPSSFGIADFCRSCAKCAANCPARAISTSDPEVIRGALKWPVAAERCYHYWRTQGTDCGVCLRACPFSKPDSALHRGARALIRRTTAFNRILSRADDLLYGAHPKPARPPDLDGPDPESP